MAYEMYLDSELMPVTPSSITLKIENQNKTLNLMDGSKINIPKQAGLTEISFTLLLPRVEYPFAVYDSGFVPADDYLDKIETLKVSKKPFSFIVVRETNIDEFSETNLTVLLEEYSIKEDTGNGLDVVVDVKLRQYRPYGTKTIVIVEEPKQDTLPTATVETPRETTNAPTPPPTYTVKKGDTLWAIAKKYYGNGSQYPQIFNANKDKISNPNLIYPGQVLTIP